MKNLTYLLLSIVFLVSCNGNSNKANLIETTNPSEISTDTGELESAKDPKAETSSIKAKFIEFHFGDAEHYTFEDEAGKSWDFAGSDSDKFTFSRELDDKESNESNQGWGSNKDLQGKWFKLTIAKREQPQYIDGPIVTVEFISDAVLIEK